MRKKIKIREEQFMALQNMSEEEPKIYKEYSQEQLRGDYNKMVEYYKGASQKLKRFYNLITLNSINDILTNDGVKDKIREIENIIDGYEATIGSMKSEIDSKTEMLPDDAFDSWGDRLQMDVHDVNHKFFLEKNALENLIYSIRNMITIYSDKEIGNYYGNMESEIEI